MRITMISMPWLILFCGMAAPAVAADSYTECVPSEEWWQAEKATASVDRTQRILAVTPKRCVDLRRRVASRLRELSPQPQPPSKLSAGPKPIAVACQTYGPQAIQVSVTPHKTNFTKGDAPKLQKLLGCSKFKVVYGTNSRYKDVPIEIVTYVRPLRVDRLGELLRALNSMDVFIKFVCLDVGINPNLRPNMFMLTGKGPGDWENLGPITPDLMRRLDGVQTEAEALKVLGEHAHMSCNSSARESTS